MKLRHGNICNHVHATRSWVLREILIMQTFCCHLKSELLLIKVRVNLRAADDQYYSIMHHKYAPDGDTFTKYVIPPVRFVRSVGTLPVAINLQEARDVDVVWGVVCFSATPVETSKTSVCVLKTH